jgi:anaerobic ribonucleoside-triphosphate reductase activating protein
MEISRAHYPVIALGPGVRVGIWTQGCSLHCPGCVAQDTWPRRPRSNVQVGEILDFVRRHPDIDGVTISGGEPLDQVGELMALLRGLRELFPKGSRVDLLVYTGRPRPVVEHGFAPVLGLADVWAVGPYRAAEPTDHPLLGSANQELLLLSELGRSRYAGYAPSGRMGRRLVQVARSGDRYWTVGIPAAGDLEALEAAAAARGVVLDQASWRAGES